jgi:hypothetical protein
MVHQGRRDLSPCGVLEYGAPDLEYGASAVFPCGVTPARLKDGRLPHRRTPIKTSSSATLADDWATVACQVEPCGSAGVRIDRRLRPHGKTVETPYSK